ncbi:MAG TPA: TIGR03619 family F420-dependent LLM class oxidoreductase [Acidimicrobiales bacterium]|nr:TIGR03619 family F420-dependent LLM class oxidoreductase [Acidimicrobiales bacterium]
MTMTFGVHLPQYGRVASGDAVVRAARHAEDLGFADLWVSDHVVHPAEQNYPSPFLLDPFATLSFAAAVTARIRVGTSILVAPQHNPVWLANHLASLDYMSGGRLIVGAGVGWSEREYDALGETFSNRGRRMDEILDLLRTAWRDDPVTFTGDHYSLSDIRILPKPAHRIPIWIGGGVETSFRRAVERGDGFHVVGLKPPDVVDIVQRLRRDRPELSFVISVRTGWDPQGMDPGLIAEECAAFEAAGIQHMVSAPWRKDLDAWLKSMDLLADIVRPSV